MFMLKKKICLQGNCSSKPSVVDLDLSGVGDLFLRKPGQCVLVTDVRFFRAEQNIWLDNLFIQHRLTDKSEDNSSLLDCLSSNCKLWLTSITLHGDINSTESLGGLGVGGGQVYAEGSEISLHVCPSAAVCFKKRRAACLFQASAPSHIV
jgi:hypothetical protein